MIIDPIVLPVEASVEFLRHMVPLCVNDKCHGEIAYVAALRREHRIGTPWYNKLTVASPGRPRVAAAREVAVNVVILAGEGHDEVRVVVAD